MFVGICALWAQALRMHSFNRTPFSADRGLSHGKLTRPHGSLIVSTRLHYPNQLEKQYQGLSTLALYPAGVGQCRDISLSSTESALFASLQDSCCTHPIVALRDGGLRQMQQLIGHALPHSPQQLINLPRGHHIP